MKKVNNAKMPKKNIEGPIDDWVTGNRDFIVNTKFACADCGQKGQIIVQEFVLVSGGPPVFHGLVFCCKECSARKGSRAYERRPDRYHHILQHEFEELLQKKKESVVV